MSVQQRPGPAWLDKPPHARRGPAYLAIYRKRGYDGKPYSVAEYWTPFVTSLADVAARTKGMIAGGYNGLHAPHPLLGITDVCAQVTHLPAPQP